MSLGEAKSVGFIGAGQMARALVGGVLNAKLLGANAVTMSDHSQDTLDSIHKDFGVCVTRSNLEVVQKSDVVIIAVKPNIVPAVLKEIAPVMTTHKLLISVAAGVPVEFLSAILGEAIPIIRCMPNTPALYGVGATAYCGNAAGLAKGAVAEKLFNAVGITALVEERDIDAIVGVAGSAPAYVYAFIEALADGGVRAGLQRGISQRMAAQTVMGAAKMVLESGQHPGQLKDNVCSAGGATIAAIHALEKGGFRGTVIDAVLAAAKRSHELAPKL